MESIQEVQSLIRDCRKLMASEWRGTVFFNTIATYAEVDNILYMHTMILFSRLHGLK